jgi:hypothetical protein
MRIESSGARHRRSPHQTKGKAALSQILLALLTIAPSSRRRDIAAIIRSRRSPRGNDLAEIWLNVPQAVVLEATEDLERANGLVERNPLLLVIRATRLLPPLARVPIEPDASDAELQLAARKVREEIEPQQSRRCYAISLRRVHSKLRGGVTIKGRRAPNVPVDIIDPAEFVCLELDGVDAVDPRTGKPVFYDLLVCARELIEGRSEDSSRTEFSSAPRKRDIGGESTRRPPPVSDRDLFSWYEERVAGLIGGGGAPSGQADWEAAKRQFSGRITRSRVRELRDQLAPPEWKKQGRRPPRTAK